MEQQSTPQWILHRRAGSKNSSSQQMHIQQQALLHDVPPGQGVNIRQLQYI
jgi:hypothetical protein